MNRVDIRFVIIALMLVLVGCWRVYVASEEMTGWTNFSPVGAMALFGGFYLMGRFKALLIPVFVLFLSDIVLMNTLFAEFSNGLLYSGWYWTYGSFVLIALLGEFFKRSNALVTVLIGGLSAGIIHFLVTNFGVWLGGGMNMATGLPLERSWAGLVACYAQAIPFFKSFLMGNFIFGGILFGAFELAKLKFSVLNRPSTVNA